MIIPLHIAAQYLAAAAISFVEKEEDDSHTNLAWSIENSSLVTRPLSNAGDVLRLNFSTFSLEWYNYDQLERSLPLGGIEHQKVLQWLQDQLEFAGGTAEFNYSFHYDLGYQLDMSDYTFPMPLKEEISKIAQYYSTAQRALQEVLKERNLQSEIRVWPHHFDMGAFVNLHDRLSIGFGLAIPDKKINDFYFYISAYNGHDALETSQLNGLSLGTWHKDKWKAGCLNANETDVLQAMQFFNEGITAYRMKYE